MNTLTEAKQISEADKAAKDRAQRTITIFNTICDDYNDGKLNAVEPLGITMLKVYQQDAKIALRLFKKLLESTQEKPVQMYMIFVAKILLRLSHLIHNRTIETTAERFNHISEIRKKYALIY